MRSRKVIIAFTIILPLLGVLTMVTWASSARKAAFDGAKMYSVLTVTKDIPSGTPASALGGYVKETQVPYQALQLGTDGKPATIEVDSSETSATASTDCTTEASNSSTETKTVPLYPSTVADLQQNGATDAVVHSGALLLNSDVLTPLQREKLYGVQPGDTEIALNLDGARGSAGNLHVGSLVTVYASFGADSTNPYARTGAIVYNVRVSRFNGIGCSVDSTTTNADGSKTTDDNKDPSALVTVAVDPEAAQRIIYAEEYGQVYLAVQNPNTDTSPKGLTTIKDLESPFNNETGSSNSTPEAGSTN